MKAMIALLVGLFTLSGITAATPAEAGKYQRRENRTFSRYSRPTSKVVRVREVYKIDKRGGGHITAYRIYSSDGTSTFVRVETNSNERGR